MLTIHVDMTDKNAVLLPDALYKDYVTEAINTYLRSDADCTIIIGNEVGLNWFRLAVKKRTITHDDIQFTSPHGDLPILPNGKMINLPSAFETPWQDVLMELV
jgi:hypothetical protein